MRIKKSLSICILTGCLLFLWNFFGTASYAQEQRIPDGVEVEGINLAGMTPEEAKAALTDYVNQVKSRVLYLTMGEEQVEIAFSDFGVDITDASVINNLANIGQGNNVIRRYMEISDVQNKNARYSLQFTCNQEALVNILNERSAEINREAVDAAVVRHGGEFILSGGENGRVLQVSETAARVVEQLNGAWDRQNITLEMVLLETPPTHTLEELSVITDQLATYTTDFSSSSSNRINNVNNGALKIDETILYPGDEFSFTQAVAPFTAENGYEKAGAYASGKTVQSMGGGICQVSSTLYNTVLRAELTVVERTNHMMTVGYVPLGADATISEGTIDFRFRNDYDYPVYIEAYTYGGTLTVSIYGKETRPANRTVSFESVTEQTISPGADVVTEDSTRPDSYMEVTQSAHTGYVAAFYKNVYIDGVLESQELVNRSTYNAYPRYVTKGTIVTQAEEPSVPTDVTPEPDPVVDAPVTGE